MHELEIDGSQGEGGGQIIRTSLALSAITGTAIRLTHIRGGRKKPGLLRQHLTCVKAAAQICNARVEGDQLGAGELKFLPQGITPGDYSFSIGSAGSTSLVLQTILPALMLADQESTVELCGGTHNPWAPSFDFLVRVFAPHLAEIGPQLSGELTRYGFYPAGGGIVRYRILPSQALRGIELLDRIGTMRPHVTAIVSDLPKSVAERECDTICRKANWRRDAMEVMEVSDPAGPGNVVMIQVGFDHVTELFTGFGKVGVKAEQVARGVLREARRFLACDAPVGEYLADQLLLPLGLAASQGKSSRFRTMPLTQHSRTHIDILRKFLDIAVQVRDDEDCVTVELGPKN